jgi:hypothetical protein
MDFTRFLNPNIGAVGILVLVVLLILWGLLLPRSTVKALLDAKSEQISLYKSAYEASMETVGIKDRQIGQLMEMARTTTHVIEALPGAIEREGGADRAAMDVVEKG